LVDNPLTAWHAVRVRSRHEKLVFAQLQARQHDVFLPLYAAKHKWADRWKTVSLPLFPGYLFCRVARPRRSSVLATPGVIDLVRSGSEPAPIADKEIDAIQKAVNSPLFTEPYAGLVNGQRVMMTEGPLKGVTGILMETRRNLRMVLSVELLQRSVVIEIEREWIAPLEPERSLLNWLDSASEYPMA
jgi:transcription antitermination factor NusG